MEFFEVREYQVGDDIRTIDWNVTAREGKPYVKKYVEERELTVMFLLDVSRSGYFGSVNGMKKDIGAEVCSVLAGSAMRNNDKVGLIAFTDRIEKYIPPRKGSRHAMRIIREMLYTEPEGRGTDIPLALEYLQKTTNQSTITFLVSDFYSDGIKKPLSIANKKHDIVAVWITDPRDFGLPDVGVVKLDDPENNTSYFVDTGKSYIRQKYSNEARKKEDERKRLFYSTNIDFINIDTSRDYSEELLRFFSTRKIRRI
jgi:uncharacterized protein (DUF58 family)